MTSFFERVSKIVLIPFFNAFFKFFLGCGKNFLLACLSLSSMVLTCTTQEQKEHIIKKPVLVGLIEASGFPHRIHMVVIEYNIGFVSIYR